MVDSFVVVVVVVEHVAVSCIAVFLPIMEGFRRSCQPSGSYKMTMPQRGQRYCTKSWAKNGFPGLTSGFSN